MASLSTIIERKIKESGMLKKDFLEKIKFSGPGFDSALLNNEFKYSVLVRIAKAFDIPLSSLIKLTESKSKYDSDFDNSKVEEDPFEYLTERGKLLLEENRKLKQTLKDKETIINAYIKLHGKL